MKNLLFALFYALGLAPLAAWWNRRRVLFLCYHGVTELDTHGPLNPKGLHVNQHRFAAQLDYLQRRYRVIALGEYLAARQAGRALPPYSVVLTSDDGFRNFLTVAAPQRRARGMPATVFLITDQANGAGRAELGRAWRPEDDTCYLSWAEARALQQEQQIEFGSHTCSHPRLPTLTPEETERELRDSYHALMRHLAVARPALSYPKGDHAKFLASQARRLGYSCAVTADHGASEADAALFMLGRTLMGDFDDEAAFAVRVSGLRDWLVKTRVLLGWPSFNQPRLAPHAPSAQNIKPKIDKEFST